MGEKTIMTVFRKSLPAECSSDWHQIIAKAIFLEAASDYHACEGGQVTFTRAQLERAADTEFEYGFDGEKLTFRPVKG